MKHIHKFLFSLITILLVSNGYAFTSLLPRPDPIRVLVISPAESDWYEMGTNRIHGPNPFHNYRPEATVDSVFEFDFTTETNFDKLARDYNVIVANNTAFLSKRQAKILSDFTAKGGGLLLAGEVSCYDRNRKFTDYDYISKMIGDEPARTEMVRHVPAALRIRFGAPGTLNLAPGLMLGFSPTKKVLYLKSLNNSQPIGYWAEDEYTESDPLSIPRLIGMAARSYKNGRVVWYGGDLQDFYDDEANKRFVQILNRDLLYWLAGRANASIAPWPDGKKTAILIHGDIEDQFEKVMNLMPVLKKYKIRSTFNILMDVGDKFPEVIVAMRETGAELGIHGDVHDAFGGQPFELQKQRITTVQDFVERFGPRPKGLRPPTISYDANTLRAAKDCGLIYVAADEDPDRYYPRLVPYFAEDTTAGYVVVYPKCELDDYDLMVRFGLLDNNQIVEMCLTDYDLIDDCGGLYKFNYHSQYLAKKEFMPSIDNLFAKITKEDHWIAPLVDISTWILKRAYLNVQSTQSDSAFTVLVKNYGTETVNGASLVVSPPATFPLKEIHVVADNQRCYTKIDNGNLIFSLPTISPGQETLVQVILPGQPGYDLKTSYLESSGRTDR